MTIDKHDPRHDSSIAIIFRNLQSRNINEALQTLKNTYYTYSFSPFKPNKNIGNARLLRPGSCYPERPRESRADPRSACTCTCWRRRWSTRAAGARTPPGAQTSRSRGQPADSDFSASPRPRRTRLHDSATVAAPASSTSAPGSNVARARGRSRSSSRSFSRENFAVARGLPPGSKFRGWDWEQKNDEMLLLVAINLIWSGYTYLLTYMCIFSRWTAINSDKFWYSLGVSITISFFCYLILRELWGNSKLKEAE